MEPQNHFPAPAPMFPPPLLHFAGVLTHERIVELGQHLRTDMQAAQASPSTIADVLVVYVEMMQNILHYTIRQGYAPQDAIATVMVARDESGHHVVSSDNGIEPEDGRRLIARVQFLAQLDGPQLKAAWKEQLHRPRNAHGGTGLGLITIARKSVMPPQASLQEQPGGRACFNLRATI